jgi:diguanylate cyclase (GGDEF)-like protein/PAS domain S-box-containing protein
MDRIWQPKGPSVRPRWPGLPAGQDAFWLLVDSIRDYAIFLLDDDGLIQSWNTGAEMITGYAAEEVVGRHFALLFTADEVEGGWPQRELALATRGGRAEDEGWRLRKDGQRFWASVVTTAMRRPDGTLYGYSTIIRDLTERKEREEALKRSVERSRQLWTQSVKDPLTGAFNRRYMVEQLRGAVDRANWVTASLLLIDIDHFKAVNDQAGHVGGDTVLVGIAALARRLSRDSDLLFRLGGDEFLLYLPGVARAGALNIAERLRAGVENSGLVPGGTVTVSIGVAELRKEDDADRWMQNADAALYEAKRAGRNRVG